MLLSLLTCGIVLTAEAQQFSITAGNINTCTGALEDSGGPAAQYSDGENFTVVICPDVPGDVINIQWIVWDLNTAGPNNNLDRIRVWDGDNTGETFLGEYTGNDPMGMVNIQGTTYNTTGCLTVQFISNSSGTGDFAAAISCVTPCDRPTAVATMNEAVPALICQGETVDFDGSASYAAPGFNIVDYTWHFDDGTTASGPTASHAFTEPGEYVVQLSLLDNNDCANTNVVDLQVLVSTTPSFEGTIESHESCLGATIDLEAIVTPTTWTGMPESNFGGQLELPDDVGIPFVTELEFTQFEPGQTLNNVSEFLSVCVSMEHSYMGDLVLSLTCPNGQSVIMHQQNGGNIFLGDANDGDSGSNIQPGTCWDYCWSPTATNPTWATAATSGMTTPVSQGNALISGTYSSVQPFSQLLGCPLNGAWTFTSTDLWGADNGTICGWSINFDPSIIPEATQFTPEIGITDNDSAWWSGPELMLDPNNPLIGSASPTAPGSYDYTFNVTDNFGCSYDTTITITVPDPIQVEAGPDIILCNDPLPMAGEVINSGPTNCVWILELYESWGDTWNGGASVTVTIDGVSSTYSISASGVTTQSHNLNITAGSTVSIQYTAGSIFNGENSFSLFDDMGTVIYDSPNGPSSGVAWSGTGTCGGSNLNVTYAWSPIDGLDDPSDPTTNVYVTQPTWYYLSAYPMNNPDCAVLDSVLVAPDPSIDAGENVDLSVCANEPVFNLIDSLGGTPDAGGAWTLNGAPVPDQLDPLTAAEGTYTYTLTSAAGCVATSQIDLTIIPVDDPTCCGIADAGEDSYSCDLTINLSATPGNTGVGTWTGPAGAMFDDPDSPQTMVTMPPGSGGTHTFYWIEDDGAFCYLIDSVQKTFTDQIVIDFDLVHATCFGDCDGEAQSTVTGGNAANGFSYDWSGGTGIFTPAITDLCAGEYTLTVTDDNGCTETDTITITEPVLLEIDSLATQPVTCSGDCDGQVELYDAEAVEISFNAGAIWGTTNIHPNACEGIYNILIRDSIGCIGSGAIDVTGPPPVLADFEWGPDGVNVDHPLVQFLNTSENANTYDWDIAGLLQTTEQDPMFMFDHRDPATYEVCLIAYNMNMCSDTICHLVEIEDVLFTYIPNSFTPNGDDLNEEFRMSINIDVITDFRMTVFDRWGQVVYDSTDPYEGWNGGFGNGGEVLKSDVYAYRITFEIFGSQTRKEYLGHVTLMK